MKFKDIWEGKNIVIVIIGVKEDSVDELDDKEVILGKFLGLNEWKGYFLFLLVML